MEKDSINVLSNHRFGAINLKRGAEKITPLPFSQIISRILFRPKFVPFRRCDTKHWVASIINLHMGVTTPCQALYPFPIRDKSLETYLKLLRTEIARFTQTPEEKKGLLRHCCSYRQIALPGR